MDAAASEKNIKGLHLEVLTILSGGEGKKVVKLATFGKPAREWATGLACEELVLQKNTNVGTFAF